MTDRQIKMSGVIFIKFKPALLLLFIALAVNQTIHAQLYGDFPYHQDFTSGIKPDEVTLPTGAGPNSAVFTPTGLQLTPAENYKFGAVFLDNKIFNSAVGIKISFNYAIYSGTGADGISVFLFDAAVKPLIGGAYGGALGYSFRRSNNLYTANRKEGLSGAYLGIALDAFGNFKNRIFSSVERVNGVKLPGILWKDNAKSHITLRGANGTYLDENGRGTGFTGYPVLTTLGTLELSRSNGVMAGATLNGDGNYDIINSFSGNRFNLRSEDYTADPNNVSYRKAFIDLIPNSLGGYNITVKVQHQNTITTVIDNYWYRTSITYTENANPEVTDFNNSDESGIDTKHTIATPIPESFRIGFAASTGSLNDIHKIWNLDIVLPFAAEAKDDAGTICRNSEFIFNPLANDLAYTGPTTGTPAGLPQNIDLTQFKFLNMDGSAVPNPHMVTNLQGTFSYNQGTGMVTFSPLSSFSGRANIKYSIKGKTYPAGTFQPYGDEAYRSAPAEISVNVVNCKIITNPALPSKL